MKRSVVLFVVRRLGWLLVASNCFAQMYTVTDLGSLGASSSYPRGINVFGQVVGYSDVTLDPYTFRAFRTAPHRPINPATDDLGPFPPVNSYAGDINDRGQVVGEIFMDTRVRAFRTSPNRTIDPATDDLGTLGGTSISYADGINIFGQVVGWSSTVGDTSVHAFRTARNRPIDSATDDLGTLGGQASEAWDINAVGQVVGSASTGYATHAYRTKPNRSINPVTDDLGTLGGQTSSAWAVNGFGQVVGWSTISGDLETHAFRTAPNKPINPSTDDLGTLGSTFSQAFDIDNYGQVVGSPAFVFSGGAMHDLNKLIPIDSGWVVGSATAINDMGEISAQGTLTSEQGTLCCRAMLLKPIYRAFIKAPINIDGSTILRARRERVPVKFRLTKYGERTCDLPRATVAITRAVQGNISPVDLPSGTDFTVNGCHYLYHLAPRELGVGVYRIDISIDGIMVGHAVFSLR